MAKVSVDKAQKDLRKVLRQVNQTNKPVVIVNEDNSGVILSMENWSNIKETLYLENIPGMGKSIKKGLEEPLEDCKKNLQW